MLNYILSLLLPRTTASLPVAVRFPLGTLHGFPSMIDAGGLVIADGELTQEVANGWVLIRLHWDFADGRQVEERDEFRAGATLSQERYAWVERRAGVELRRFEVDFTTGKASSSVRDPQGQVAHDERTLRLPAGRSFTGLGVAVAVPQLALGPGEKTELTFVAFTARPLAIGLQVLCEDQQQVEVAGRSVTCNRFALHPMIPFPFNLLAGVKDAYLWLTHAAPAWLVRAEQNLVTQADPRVVIDTTPRGAMRRTLATVDPRGTGPGEPVRPPLEPSSAPEPASP